ncbi:MAG: tetratricopeptide repeat protein [Candidatus Zipacnadales bacterium]
MAEPTGELTPQQQRAYYKMRTALADLRNNDRKAARAKLEEALDLDHELVEARLWLAHLLLEEGDIKAAVAQYQTGLMFSPQEERLSQGLQAAQTAAIYAQRPEAKDEVAAKQRLVPNLILAALLPPSGFLLGLWEIATGRTREWKDLGLKTLLTSLAAFFAWFILLAFVEVVIEGARPGVAGDLDNDVLHR